jgi:RNA polymerase sigma-70 factor (ECF subfamily)
VPGLETSGELELINRARAGSVDAFEQLVFRYQDRLYRFLAARAGNRADAEDVLQETFVAAYKYLSGYRSKYAFSTWLFTIALRKLGGVSARNRAGHAELPEQIPCQQPGPEQLGSRAERRESLWTLARSCLNESQFTALWLFYVEDMSQAEIAKTVRRPVSWVKVNLLRARRRMLSELQQANDTTTIPTGEVHYEQT